MEVGLHKAARKGDIKLLTRVLRVESPPKLTLCVTPQKNTALHIAVTFGHHDIVLNMIERQPSLISQQNSNGDTPLHMAARAGNLTLTKFLTPPEGALGWLYGVNASTKENSDGYTALREALRTGHEPVALHLLRFVLRFDQQLRGVQTYVTEAGESLLYLASEAGLTRVVNEMIERRFRTEGRNGQNPLHIAVITGKLRVVKLLKDRAPYLIKEADGFGKTALHYASIIGNYDDDGSRTEILKVLIGAEPSLAYKPDNDGNYPLLMATMKAPFNAVETILQHCPDSAELVDRSGRNALHLAVKKNKESTLRLLLNRPEFRMLINGPDYAGNTPMHLAAQHQNEEIVGLLLECKNADLSVKNKEGLTALDICGYATEQRLIHDKLKEYGAVPSGQEQWEEMLLMPRPQKFRLPYVDALAEALQLSLPLLLPQSLPLPQPQPTAFSLTPELSSTSSKTETAMNALSIVTTLIATVTFSAIFTPPDDQTDKGLALNIFLISDSIAFCSSMAATILLVYASVNPEDKFLHTSTINTCTCIATVAISATIVAFVTSIYMLQSTETMWLALTSILVGFSVPVFVLWLVRRLKRRDGTWKEHRPEYYEEIPAGPIPRPVDVPECQVDEDH